MPLAIRFLPLSVQLIGGVAAWINQIAAFMLQIVATAGLSAPLAGGA